MSVDRFSSFREPLFGFTPLMEAAASGHEIIVQYLLDRVSMCARVRVLAQLQIRPLSGHMCGSLYVLMHGVCCAGCPSRGEELQR